MLSTHTARQRLGLSSNADQREVRRAYARELKKIDQEKDPAGFQFLREAYERALDNACAQAGAKKESQTYEYSPVCLQNVSPGKPINTPLVFPTTPQASQSKDTRPESDTPHYLKLKLRPLLPEKKKSTPIDFSILLQANYNKKRPKNSAPRELEPSPEYLANGVFNEFIEAFKTGSGGSNGVLALLLQAMEDSRLTSVDARDYFEWLAAQHLAKGWQPGNEALFETFTDFFKWKQDPKRLLRFQDAGTLVNIAICEHLAFNKQNAHARSQQLDLIRRLRTDFSPLAEDLLILIPQLNYLTQRYPNLLKTITNKHNIDNWYVLGEKFLGKGLSALGSAPTLGLDIHAHSSGESNAFIKGMYLLIAGLFLCFSMMYLVGSTNPPKTHPPSTVSPEIKKELEQHTKEINAAKQRIEELRSSDNNSEPHHSQSFNLIKPNIYHSAAQSTQSLQPELAQH